MQNQTVICLKWGNRYRSEYVNKMYRMVLKNTVRPLRFVCITDDVVGIDPQIETFAMPVFDLPEVMRFHPFRRMFLFDERVGDLHGTVLHLDLDLIVTGSIDCLFDYKIESRFVTIENWTQRGKGIGNMSVFRYRIGELQEVWRRFRPNPLEMMRLYSNSQSFVSRTLGNIDFYPPEWCLSFKHSLVPRWPLNIFKAPHVPQDAKIVTFTGKPDIDEAAKGEWPVDVPWKKIYKVIRPSPWISAYWE